MNCRCGRPLEMAVHRVAGRWLGFTRCLPCDPGGAWEPRGDVGVIWAPPPLPPAAELVNNSGHDDQGAIP